MGCVESDLDEPLFTNHVTLLLGLFLPKYSFSKKIAFVNKYYGVIKHNDVQKILCKKCKDFLLKNTVQTLKNGGSSIMF